LLGKEVTQKANKETKENLPSRIKEEFGIKERNALGAKQRESVMLLFARLETYKASFVVESN